ncbi:MAG: 2,3-bisphosphoglycerate-dependent phosphoglycerate mutase [Patescibacteria group bacterium]|nr:2,3-bisphosphoglycerate-dependent phosphoglycerate mutase [Patescibacteria group bacterium]
MMGKLLLARHHESEWNKKGLWTGSRDVHLTQYGFDKSAEMGKLIEDIPLGAAFASIQVRSIETLACMLEALNINVESIPVEYNKALDERNYGDYTGKNKWEMEKLIGTEAFDHIRRDWDCPVPNGETLKMVYERAVPYYQEKIVPLLKEGKNVLVVSHGNALRALMLHIESMPHEDAAKLEMLFGGIVIYDLTEEGHMVHKEVRQVHSEVNA